LDLQRYMAREDNTYQAFNQTTGEPYTWTRNYVWTCATGRCLMYNIWPADQVGSQGIACYVSAFPYPKNATEFMAEVSGSKYGVDPTYSDRYPWNLVDTGLTGFTPDSYGGWTQTLDSCPTGTKGYAQWMLNSASLPKSYLRQQSTLRGGYCRSAAYTAQFSYFDSVTPLPSTFITC